MSLRTDFDLNAYNTLNEQYEEWVIYAYFIHKFWNGKPKEWER